MSRCLCSAALLPARYTEGGEGGPLRSSKLVASSWPDLRARFGAGSAKRQSCNYVNQNTQEVKKRTFQYRQDKTMCECSAYVAFKKATNGQTDMKHEKE